MKIGIVGSEGAKFTHETEAKAHGIIFHILRDDELHEGQPLEAVVSGGCHLGGIDIWARDAAIQMGVPFIEFKPAKLTWSGGYKERNLQIASESDIVVCITLKELPPDYKGMRFKSCYHCGTSDHVKSGGCWTVKQAIKMRKKGQIIVIE